MDNQTLYTNTYPQSLPSRRKQILLLTAIGIGIIAVIVIVSKLISSLGMGTLQITSQQSGAAFTLISEDTATKELGSNTVKVRVKPGRYQVVGTLNQMSSRYTVTINRRQTTVVDVKLQPVVPTQKLSALNGQNILAKDNHLYFVQQPDKVLYDYDRSTGVARPYMTKANGIVAARWFDPNQLLFRDAINNWAYANKDVITPLLYKGKTTIPTSFSINEAGMVAYITTDGTAVTAKNATAAPTEITSVHGGNGKTSIAPNGSVAVYVPTIGDHGDDASIRIYNGDQSREVPRDVVGANNISWATDSNSFSYTMDGTGLYTYSLGTNAIEHVVFGELTNPGSTLWLTESRFLYADFGSIWLYDAKTKASTKLANLSGDLDTQICPFTLSADKKTIYYGTTNQSAGEGGIYQLVPDFNSLSSAEQQALTSLTPAKELQYTGLKLLSQEGLTSDHIANIKFALSKYIRATNPSAATITLSDISIQLRDTTKADSKPVATFSVHVNNGKTYSARVIYDGIGYTQTLLYDQGKQVYDSGVTNSL